MAFQVLAQGFDLFLLAAQVGVLLVERQLALLELVLHLERLRVALVDICLVLALELEELFLRLEDLLLLQGLALGLGLLENLLPLALQYDISDQDVGANGHSGRDNGG